MNHLYRRLAWTNIRNNRQFYLPYLLTGMLSVMLFYCMRAIQGSTGLLRSGGQNLVSILTFGTIVIGMFVVVLLFYTNSFIMKRRKKELGVYNILGMEKRHIAKVLFWETLVAFVVSVGGGLIVGIMFHKLLTMFLYRLTNLEETVPFYVSGQGAVQTVELFGMIFLLNLCYNFMQIKLANPVELLHSENAGEREPKTKVLMALVGIICIGSGYYIAITTENVMKVLPLFFVAVVLVIAGTYLLFTAGSIAFLKLLRKNKKFYYRTKNFTAVSGMIYRMKQNAVGLANICILSTMVLVMVSTTVSMYIGLEDELDYRYPMELSESIYFTEVPQETVLKEAMERSKQCVTGQGRIITGEKAALYISATGVREDNRINLDGARTMDTDRWYLVYVMTKESFASYLNAEVPKLAPGEVAVAASTRFDTDSLYFQEKEYRIAEENELVVPESERTILSMVGGVAYIAVEDEAALQEIYDTIPESGDGQITAEVSMDIDGTREEQQAAAYALRGEIESWKTDTAQPSDLCGYSGMYLQSRAEGYQSFLSLNGGLFFLGLFLGIMFLMVTVLIIYYKQISEGYEDKERFAIMEKVGMSNDEVRATINAQVRIVFSLPLITAAIHLAAAFPMLRRLLAMLQLTNAKLFVACLIGTVLVFGIIYTAVFVVTSRSYYKIVGGQA